MLQCIVFWLIAILCFLFGELGAAVLATVVPFFLNDN